MDTPRPDVDPEILPKLTAEHLLAIGVGSVGHRRNLLEAIAALAKPAATGSEYITMISNGCHWPERLLAAAVARRHPGVVGGWPPPAQPRPMNGILVAMMVMNWTLASSGRLAM